MINLAGHEFVDFTGPAVAKAAPGVVALVRRFASARPPEIVAAVASRNVYQYMQNFVRARRLSSAIREYGAPGVAVLAAVRATPTLKEAQTIAALLDPKAARAQEKELARDVALTFLQAHVEGERTRAGIAKQLRLLRSQIELLELQCQVAALADRAKTPKGHTGQ